MRDVLARRAGVRVAARRGDRHYIRRPARRAALPAEPLHRPQGLAAGRTASWRPATAAVVAGVNDRHADSCDGCCPVLNFFASSENAERWLNEHPHVHGEVITIEEAIAVGRAIFAYVLTEN